MRLNGIASAEDREARTRRLRRRRGRRDGTERLSELNDLTRNDISAKLRRHFHHDHNRRSHAEEGDLLSLAAVDRLVVELCVGHLVTKRLHFEKVTSVVGGETLSKEKETRRSEDDGKE